MIYKVIIEMTLTLWAFLRTAVAAIGALGTNTILTRPAGAVGLPAARSVNVNHHGAGEQRTVPRNCSRPVVAIHQNS